MSTILDHLDDVGPGWSSLLRELHDWLIEHGVTYSVDQVKEKFGGLRVYLDCEGMPRHASWTDVQAKIGHVTALSTVTCERCGKPGGPTSTRWIKTLCREHANEHAATEQERRFPSTKPLDRGTETEES